MKGSGMAVTFHSGTDKKPVLRPPERCPMNSTLTAAGEFLHPFGGQVVRKSETGNELLQVGPELALRVGDMDGKIDIHGPQGVPGAIQFLIDQHDPTADHH